MKASSINISPGSEQHADAVKLLVYQSVHELMDFMFDNEQQALPILGKLLRMPSGQFGHRYLSIMQDGDKIVGIVLGYSRTQFLESELPGAINMLRATPLRRWPHLVGTVGKALSGYVPPPSEDAFYINNIAVDASSRGNGYGTTLLNQLIDISRQQGFRCLELDVTHINEAAIRFYQRHGFVVVSESGSELLYQRHRLPLLKRMRLVIAEQSGSGPRHSEVASSGTLIREVTGLYPVEVDEVYAPGTIKQLQQLVKSSNRPLSVGGGHFSMGGQTAIAGSLHIDMRGLDQVIDIDAEKRLIRVQSGICWKQLQRYIDDFGLSVKIMQTYSNFTVGGSLSVNCHGRYVGLGPLILSVRSIDLLLADGKLVKATPRRNAKMFYGAIGGYGAIGIIVSAELELEQNRRLERVNRKMPVEEYLDFFNTRVRDNEQAVFHNADMIPPGFKKVHAVTWRETDKAVNSSGGSGSSRLHLLEKYMLWAITETPAGHFRREYIYEPLLFLRSKVAMRNQEADYDVAELEPLSRDRKTYVLQEYFVGTDRLGEFSQAMGEILDRHKVSLVNVSIRHAHPDPGSLLAWARKEVFAFVLYYKQGTSNCDRERVAVWTRELIDAAIACEGSYYLPYQPHARYDQFHAAYPQAQKLFDLKDRLDPDYRFRNVLWEKYYRARADPPLYPVSKMRGSEFLSVYGRLDSRDDFYRFLQIIYHLYPEDRFHELIIKTCESYQKDADIYAVLARKLPEIRTRFADLTYALPALAKQKREMQRQTVDILDGLRNIDGYLEIGSTGRYVRKLTKALGIRGKIYLCNENRPDNSPPELMERGGLGQVGHFFDLNDYEPIPASTIADASLDLVSCYIGLHHCPRERLADYIKSIHRVLRPGGRFVLRDHDAGSERMRTFCKLVHTVFNAGLGVDWQQDRAELRLFEGVDFWAEQVCRAGFSDSGKRLLQGHDPSLNTLMCFRKN